MCLFWVNKNMYDTILHRIRAENPKSPSLSSQLPQRPTIHNEKLKKLSKIRIDGFIVSHKLSHKRPGEQHDQDHAYFYKNESPRPSIPHGDDHLESIRHLEVLRLQNEVHKSKHKMKFAEDVHNRRRLEGCHKGSVDRFCRNQTSRLIAKMEANQYLDLVAKGEENFYNDPIAMLADLVRQKKGIDEKYKTESSGAEKEEEECHNNEGFNLIKLDFASEVASQIIAEGEELRRKVKLSIGVDKYNSYVAQLQ